MNKPSIGRVVWVIRPLKTTDIRQPEIGVVTYVLHSRMIDVRGFDHNGVPFIENSLMLLQDDDAKPEGSSFACWMPYQKGQAARHDKELK